LERFEKIVITVGLAGIIIAIAWGVLSYMNPTEEEMHTVYIENLQAKEFISDKNIMENSTDKKLLLQTILKFQSKGITTDCSEGWTCDSDQSVLRIGESRLNTLKELEKLNETK
jgi:hypothetical protein